MLENIKNTDIKINKIDNPTNIKVNTKENDKTSVIAKTTNEDELQAIDETNFSEEETYIELNEFKQQININKEAGKIAEKYGYEKLFNLIDTNSDGKISVDEIQAINGNISTIEQILPEDLQNFIDNNKVETRSFEEILEQIREELGLGTDNINIHQTQDAWQQVYPDTSYTPSIEYYSGNEYTVPETLPSDIQGAITTDDNKTTEEEIKQLEEVDIPNTEKNIKTLEDDKNKNIKKQEDAQEKAIEESDEINAELKKDYKDAETKLKEARQKKSETESEKAEKENQLFKLDLNIKELDAKISSISTNTGDSEIDAQNKKMIEDLKTQKSELEIQKQALEDEITELVKEIETIDKEIEKHKTEKNNALDKIKANLKPDSPLLKVIEETEKEIEKINQDYKNDSTDLNNTLQEQKDKLGELKAEKGKNEGEKQNLKEFGKLINDVPEFQQGVFANMGDKIEEIANKYDIDPMLFASIIAQETGYGTSNAVKNKNNPGGMMDPETNWSTLKKYDSLEEGLEAMAKNLSKNYIKKGLTTISSIGNKYCPVGAANDPTGMNSGWIPGVTSIYNKISHKNITSKTGLA